MAKAQLRIGATGEYTWPDTLDIMGWSIDPTGFGVMLSRSLPQFVEQKFAAPARRFVKAAKLGKPRYICHPGGAKVLDAVEGALGLDEGDCARRAARCCATTATCRRRRVLFVLERAMKRACANAVLAALGPGFTASFLALSTSHA